MIRKRNVPSDQMLVGTAWYAKKPVTTCLNQCPCSGIEWCRRCRISSLISLSFARMRSRRVFRLIWNCPPLLVPGIHAYEIGAVGRPEKKSAATVERDVGKAFG